MSLDTAQKIVNFAFDIVPAGQKIHFSFFGGEPILCFHLMRKITDYMRKKEKEFNKPISIGLTSNGTLLTENALAFFKEQDIELCISIDGPEHVHNMNRVYEDGHGSYCDVLKKINLAQKLNCRFQVNAVYGPDTINNLSETVDFFCKKGIFSIHLNPNISALWKEEAYSSMRKSIKEIAEYYVKSYENRQEIAIDLIDSKTILLIKEGYEREDKCGMGETEWGFSASGNIYPCERFIGDDNLSFCFGNIRTGFNIAKRCSILERRGNTDEKCKTCVYEKYCMNWCGCTNYFMTGQSDSASKFLCESEKAAIEAAKHVFIALSNNNLFVEHYLKYLQEDHLRLVI